MTGERNIVSVTALNRYVKSLLEGDAVLGDIRLRGEISNFVHHRSGHCYFSLKDANCSVKAVMFRGDAQGLRFAPQNGMCVVIKKGNILSLRMYMPLLCRMRKQYIRLTLPQNR